MDDAGWGPEVFVYPSHTHPQGNGEVLCRANIVPDGRCLDVRQSPCEVCLPGRGCSRDPRVAAALERRQEVLPRNRPPKRVAREVDREARRVHQQVMRRVGDRLFLSGELLATEPGQDLNLDDGPDSPVNLDDQVDAVPAADPDLTADRDTSGRVTQAEEPGGGARVGFDEHREQIAPADFAVKRNERPDREVHAAPIGSVETTLALGSQASGAAILASPPP